MAAYLPSIVPGTFGSQFDGTPYSSRPSSCRAAVLNNQSENRTYSAQSKRRKPSGISFASSRSSPCGPHSLNNENTEPSTPERSLSPYNGKECVSQKTASSPAISSPPWTDCISATITSSSDKNVTLPPNDTASINVPPSVPQQASGTLKPHLETTTNIKQTPSYKDPKPSPEATLKESEDIVPSQFSKWADSFRKRKHGIAWTNTRNQRGKGARNINVYESSVYNRTFPIRRSRFRRSTSFSSSGFVETVRTASLSTTSFALMPRSIRDSQLSDGNGYCNSVVSTSMARFSSESSRHQNLSSYDEDAQHRATKRRQILDELLCSEESYIADLKVLTNLFSTILTSLPTVSSKMRSSIQHNAMTILHLHETFASDLHQAARKYATATVDLVVHRKQDFHRHTKWHSLDNHTSRATDSQVETTRKSFDVPQHSPAMLRQSTRMPIAQGSEAAEVARMVKHLVSHFFAYEEYCSKYDTMVHEIGNSHKVFPSWTAYASGVEALARSMSALDARIEDQRKGLTVGDLLIKPIQRICRYPLLLAELHKYTPVIDCPIAHVEIESTLSLLRDGVQVANRATDDPIAQDSVRRTWLLRERLIFVNEHGDHANRLAKLGHVKVCGVLFVAYQTRSRVRGEYMLCALFPNYLLLARPSRLHEMFDVIAIISLVDSKVESAEDGKGLQCHNALYSWKLIFESDHNFFELIFSACSGTEEEQWRKHLHEPATLLSSSTNPFQITSRSPMAILSLDLKPLGPVYGDADSFSRRLSIQRAATVGTRSGLCQVIIRNTVNLAEGEEQRNDSEHAINRSQSVLTTHRVGVLSPKRSERVRLEHCLSDVWSRDVIPFPGMTVSRSGNIIRASAGSLVRRLSRASMHGPFSRRSTSITIMPSKPSCEGNPDPQCNQPLDNLPSQLRSPEAHRRTKSNTENNRLIHGACGSEEHKAEPRRMSTGAARLPRPHHNVDRAQSVKAFLEVDGRRARERGVVEEKLEGKKRWSNPLGLLRHISTDSVRHLLYSSKAT